MNTSNIKKYLPLGTVVTIKNNDFFYMIVGYTQKISDNTYDYIVVKYPIGFVDFNTLAFFNHENIEEIIYLGSYNDKMNKILKQIKDSEVDLWVQLQF